MFLAYHYPAARPTKIYRLAADATTISALDVRRRTLNVCSEFLMKRFLITGASRGIGRAIAIKLAAPEATLLLHGRDTVALAETCRAVQDKGAEVVKLVHDLAKISGVERLIAEVGHDPIDVLVNNAGIAVV